jgi:small neutral amino acid transporter SnatA (MarC family)
MEVVCSFKTVVTNVSPTDVTQNTDAWVMFVVVVLYAVLSVPLVLTARRVLRLLGEETVCRYGAG